MKAELSHVRWGRVLLAGVLAAVLSIVVFLLVIVVYTISLAFQVRGQPDQAQIGRYANQVASWVIPPLAILLTVGGAVWVARKVASGAILHGFLVGLVAALSILIVGLAFGGGLDLVALVTFVLVVAAGWLGGMLGSRGRQKS